MGFARSASAAAAAATLAATLLTGCQVTPAFTMPADAVPTGTLPLQPQTTAGTAGGPTRAQHFLQAVELPHAWWTLFHCAALDALVKSALAGSPDLAQADARLREAQADMQAKAGVTGYPQVNATLSSSRQRVDTAAFGFVHAPSPPPFDLFNASVNASYMMDVFGGNRRAVEAMRARVDYRRFEFDASRLTLAANVVTAAIRRAALVEQIAATRQLLEAQRRQTLIMHMRFVLGGVSEFELRSQRQSYARAQSDLPMLEQQRAALSHQLAVYLGRAPDTAPAAPIALADLQLPGDLPTMVPSRLARRRPDVRAAEALWRAASADVGVATANLYPQLTLTGSTGVLGTHSGDLANGLNVWSLGAQLMQPIFRGGELRAKKRSAVAAYDAAAAAYRATVLQALQQVADSLTALDHDADALLARTRAADQARAQWEIIARRYAVGGVSEQTLLDARRLWLRAHIERIGALAQRYADTAVLLHALGGGYDAG